MNRLDLREMMCWHEAGHIWYHWRIRVVVASVDLLGVNRDPSAVLSSRQTLENAVAGVVTCGVKYSWDFPNAFIFGGAIGGDAALAVRAARDIRDPARAGTKEFFTDEIDELFKIVSQAFYDLKNLLTQNVNWTEVETIARALETLLPNEGVKISGDYLAQRLGRTCQF